MTDIMETGKMNKELNKIYRHLLKNDRKVLQMQEELQRLRDVSDRQFKELYFANLLHDTILNSSWLKDKSFSLYGWAANYSFIYMLYRILDTVYPTNILEMGMGQTSKVTSQYVANCNNNANLDIIENDVGWIAAYQPQLVRRENIKVHHCDLEFFKDGKCECRKYKDLSKVVKSTEYDLVIVDGPWGAEQTLPRSNILDIIKNGNLADDFIIIFDDAERKGEQKTIANTLELLKERNVEYVTFQRNGIKTQQIITSTMRGFTQYL